MKWRRDKDDSAAPDAATADGPAEPGEEAAVDEEAAAEQAELDRGREQAAVLESRRREHGPLDSSEVEQQRPHVDLGALHLPAVQGMELRLEMEEKTQRVIGAVVVLGGSTVQLQAFAAPRSTGIWAEVRTDIAAQVGRQGGATQEATGPFGTEVLARLPVRTEDGRTGHRAARFVGVDGPRWFVRAVLGGKAAVDADAARPLEQLVRALVVVRGDEAMAPRDLLPLRLPPQDQARPTGRSGGDAAGAPVEAPAGPGGQTRAADAAGPGGAGQGQDRGEDPLGPLDPFRRGPEITETR